MANISEEMQSASLALGDFSKKLDELKKKLADGTLTNDEYNKSVKELESAWNDAKVSMEGAKVSAEGATDALKEQVSETENASAKVSEYESSWEKVGATANTALGVIAASVSKSNPALASMLGSVQKLVPNLVEVGNAAKKTGSLIKGMTSTAGILALITLITTLITDFDDITESLGISTEAVNNFKTKASEAFKKVVGVIAGVGNAIANYITSPIKGMVAAFKKVIKGDFSGAWDELKNGIKNQFSFGEAFKTGQDWGEGVVQGVRDRRAAKKAAEAGKNLGDSIKEGLEESLKEVGDSIDSLVEQWAEDIPEIEDITKNLKDNIKDLSEWISLGISEEEKEIAKLNERAAAYKAAGADAVEVDRWADEERIRIEEEYQAKRDAIAEKGHEAELKRIEDEKNAEYEAKKAKLDNVTSFLSSMKEAYSTISDLISDKLDAELESGKITEEEYKKQKAALKAFSIASIISTTMLGIANAWASYMNPKDLTPAPMKAIMAAAQTAVQLASGIAGIAAINSESMSGASASTTASASVSSDNVSQQYVLNTDYSDVLNSIDKKVGNTQTVLVVDDVTKVQKNVNKVKTTSSF